MLSTITSGARRGVRGFLQFLTDPLGRRQVSRQAHLTRVAAHEQAAWLWQVVNEHAENTQRLVVDQAMQIRAAVIGYDGWKVLELETLLRHLRRKDYLAAIRSGELDVPQLRTDHPLAVDSSDTIQPRGAKNDNSICLRFNQRLYQLFDRKPGLKVLDLGCAGGGLIRTLIDDGHFAVGLEGSDYPLLNQAGEWGTIPHHLFTCDVTRPFTLTSRGTGERLRFDAITAWEVMEHIPQERIGPLMANVDEHLAPGGWVLLSIATFPDWDPVTGAVWHRTVKPRQWWEATFAELGFVPATNHPFGPHDWLRGSGNGRFDWKPGDDAGFHLALRRKADVRCER